MTTPSALHIDAPLTAFATAYRNGLYISPIPDVPTPQLGGKYKQKLRRDVNKNYDDKLGARGKASEVHYSTVDGTYILQGRGLRAPVTYSEVVNANVGLSPEEEATKKVMNDILLAKEIRHATLLTTAANYAAACQVAATAAWNAVGATPELDINNAIAAIAPSDEETEIIACMSQEVWNRLRVSPNILAMMGMKEGMVSRAQLAQYFEISEVRVSKATYDTANEGQSASYSRVWGTSSFVLFTRPKVQGTDVSGFAVNFTYQGGVTIRKYFDPSEGIGGCTFVQPEHFDQVAAIQNDMGAIITGV